MAKENAWQLIKKDTKEVVCTGQNPYDLLSWYLRNHHTSWYGYGRLDYDMITTDEKESKIKYAL